MSVGTSWVVLKFGGTSVSSAANWRNIAAILRRRASTGSRLLIVHSALSGVTDKLEQLLAGALQGRHEPVLAAIRAQHEALAQALEVDLPAGLQAHLFDLEKIASGISLVGEVSYRIRARVMATGELMATELGAAYLRKAGLSTTLLDARTILRSVTRKDQNEYARVLSATCDARPDLDIQVRLGACDGLVLTQGFIARDAAGHTVLLGRGGSDTSAAYCAGLLSAVRLEIWTDVPGMFSANPKDVPTARLLRELHYDEAQEIASSGAKVLHPRCIMPARQQDIPIHVYDTHAPDEPGTRISKAPPESGARVKAIALKKGVTLVSMESPGMWHHVGFMADAFQVFKANGLSVDLVSTSETSVTVSLDPAANALTGPALERLLEELSPLCRAEVLGPCASLSLVGRNIRGILHKLGDALALFEEHKIYLVSQAANDLSFTLVLDEAQGERLVGQLHDLLIRVADDDPVIGPTWAQLRTPTTTATRPPAWWRERRDELLALMHNRTAAYVYDLSSIRRQVAALRELQSVDQIYYAMKANGHPDVLRTVAAAGANFECVSPGEVTHVRAAVPGLAADRILFTPNFAPREEYAWAVGEGVQLTLDNLFILRQWGDLFRGREVFLRLDIGVGKGHHHHVRTAGAHSKFGIPLFELGEIAALCRTHQVRVVGLHAHAGSGILDSATWADTARALAEAAQAFPEVRVLDLGGGLGVPDRQEGKPLDLAAMARALQDVRQRHPGVQLWLEPGRFLVAASGVLLAKVTQLKGKGSVQYAGIATGMNSLIRPALYGAYHAITNLTRIGEAAECTYTVVGPICESGDQLGHDRRLPETREGDVLLIDTAGAYGYAMSSFYNRRHAAEEIALEGAIAMTTNVQPLLK